MEVTRLLNLSFIPDFCNKYSLEDEALDAELEVNTYNFDYLLC